MPKRAPRRRRKGRRKSSLMPPPSSSATSYSGPVRLPMASQQNQTYNDNLMSTTSLTSNGSGIISAVISNNLSSMNESASFVAIYDEYRVLAAEYMVVFNNNNTFNASLLQAPFLSMIDRDSSAALTSVASAFNAESALLHSTGRNFKRVCRMHSVEDSNFVTCTPGTNITWNFKVYASGLTASTNYATVFVRYLVQFRGRI